MLLIKAAEKLQDIKNIVFLIYGDGSDRELLYNYCEKNSIKNVFFKERWVDIKYVPFILSNSNLNVLNYRPNSIFRYGGSQGKLFQYLASGKPICSNLEMGYEIVKKYNAGIIAESTTPEDYAKAIIKIYNMNVKEYNNLCQNALESCKRV
jgi:glycosyltransferase involved in cell wall biosynthesis